MLRRAVGALALSTLFLGTAAQAETKLLFSVFLPPSYYLIPILHEWAADVEKATEKRVKIEFAAGSLAPPPQQLSAVQSGIFDIAVAANIFIKNKAPLIEFSSLPWVISDAEAGSVAFWRVYQKHMADKKQFSDVQLLSLFGIVGGQLYSLSDKPINSVAEMKNRKMWALPGEAADLLKNLGISPITSPAVQVSESASRGVVDGIYGMSYEAATDFKAAPYVKVITRFPFTATATGFSMFMNKSKWASIAEKDRNAILALSGDKFAARAGQAANKASSDALVKMKADGVKVVEVDPAFYAELQKAAEPSYKQFYDIAAKNGLDGKAVVEDYKQQYEALAKR